MYCAMYSQPFGSASPIPKVRGGYLRIPTDMKLRTINTNIDSPRVRSTFWTRSRCVRILLGRLSIVFWQKLRKNPIPDFQVSQGGVIGNPLQPTQSSSFSIFDMFVSQSKFLCLNKILKASKVSPSEGITAEQKIWKSISAENITSNDIFRLPEGQSNQSSSFLIFDMFDLPSKFCMPQ